MSFRNFLSYGVLFSVLMFGWLVQTQQQQTPKVREEQISIDVRDKPFGEIITGIQEQTGINIYYDDDVKDILVTMKLVNVPWKTVLEVIAKKYNCLVEEVSEKVIKVSKPPTVTMEFEGADIRDVINQIATIANKNIVVAESVKGAVSLRLKNVPWQDALEAIIKTRGYVLVREKEDRILRVVLQQDIETQLETEIYKLRYVRPKSAYVAKMTSTYFTELRQAIQTGGSSRVEISNFTLLTALNTVLTPNRGKITYDELTNTIVITDVKPKIDKMAQIIKELDKEPKQIFIDVKFINTSNSDLFDFQVGFDPGDNGIAGNRFHVDTGLGSMNHRLPFTVGSGGWEDKIVAAPRADRIAGVPTDASLAGQSGFQFSKLDFSQSKFGFTINMLKKDEKSKVIQSPKIITLDHHEATIFVGRTISFPVTELINENGVISVELKEAPNSPVRSGFQILVVPHIVPDSNKIIMTLIPSNDDATLNRYASGGAEIQLPSIEQQVLVTHMILESGQTAVMGGLVNIEQRESVRKIPFLGDIPFLGYLFKAKSISKTKKDTFIFVTPRIVQSAEDTSERVQAMVEQEKKGYGEKYNAIWREEPLTPALLGTQPATPASGLTPVKPSTVPATPGTTSTTSTPANPK